MNWDGYYICPKNNPEAGFGETEPYWLRAIAYDDLFSDFDIAIRFTNNTKNTVKIVGIELPICTCHSASKNYYTYIGTHSPCTGTLLNGSVYMYAIHDTKAVKSPSQSFVVDALGRTNMNTPGTSATATSLFGEWSHNGVTGMQIVNPTWTYDSLSPVIRPGGICYICMSINVAAGKESVTAIRALFHNKYMNIQFLSRLNNCFWVYSTADGKWLPQKPIYWENSAKGGWRDVTGENYL